MRKTALVAASIAAFTSAPALAADLRVGPAASPVSVAIPVGNWNGFYIGIQGGYGWGDVNWTYAGGADASHRTRGALLGGTIGANVQTGQWVFGVEADYAWADIRGSTACPNPAFACRSTLESFGTVRGRVGIAWSNWLLYGTGGVAFGDQNIRTVQLAGIATPASGTPVNGTNIFTAGWTAGGGVEWAFAPNWSAKIEALYFDLGRNTYTVDNALLVNARHDGVIVRGGINYRFSWGEPLAPVVARY